MATRCAKVENGQLAYAPSALKTARGTVFNASAKTLAAEGYMPVPGVETARPVTGWSVVEGALVPAYGEAPAAAPRVFSKLKLVETLMRLGKWAEVKAWIEASGLYDLYLAATEVREDNAYFTRGLAALKAQFAMTDAQVEEILAQCVAA